MSMVGQALSNWQRQDISLCRQDLLTMVTDEREYEPKSSNPEPERNNKIAKMESLLDTLSDVCQVSTTEVANRLLDKGIRSWGDFKRDVTGSTDSENPSNPESVTVECPICGDIIEIPKYDAISRSDALLGHIEEKHITPASEFHALMLHAVGEIYGPGGIVIDEARAKVTSCECVEYKPEKYWCTSKGVVGALTDEQEGLYCNPMVIVEKPALKERLTSFGEAVEYCRAQLPPTDGRVRLEIYLDCMSKKLAKVGIEA